jgi:hypothetical protein
VRAPGLKVYAARKEGVTQIKVHVLRVEQDQSGWAGGFVRINIGSPGFLDLWREEADAVARCMKRRWRVAVDQSRAAVSTELPLIDPADRAFFRRMCSWRRGVLWGSGIVDEDRQWSRKHDLPAGRCERSAGSQRISHLRSCQVGRSRLPRAGRRPPRPMARDGPRLSSVSE